jgi:hypothetical protein
MRRCGVRLLPAALLAAFFGLPPATGGGATVEPAPDCAVELLLPRVEGSLRFAAFGDSGTGGQEQRALALVMERYRRELGFELALMLGDNIYGRKRSEDFVAKFETPYRGLLDAGVLFYATLGNHDRPIETRYRPFHMDGQRYYSFRASRQSVRFFALDSNRMDAAQLRWLERELHSSAEHWKVFFVHNPPYSSGKKHGPDLPLRAALEPILLRHGVSLVLSGHEHFYQRVRPQKGIAYFISGGAAKLRRGNIRRDADVAAGYDQGLHFMLFEIEGDRLHFQAIGEDGASVDAGTYCRTASGIELLVPPPAAARSAP